MTAPKNVRRLACAAALAAVAAALTAAPAGAAIETDPQALYTKMNEAYTEGATQNWSYDAQRYYASAVLATGRSFSLFRHDDPNYPQVAALTVDIATALHYDPISNDDASPWWVREAASYVQAHFPGKAAAASELLARLDETEGSLNAAARIADADATANVEAYHGDNEARVEQVVVDLRAAKVAADPSYLLLGLSRAAQPNFPLVRLPSAVLQKVYQGAQTVLDDPQAAASAKADAKAIFARRDATAQLQEIGSINAVPHKFHLSITAPADEYFGHGGMSVLGMRNEIAHLQKYLDAGYGAREASEASGLTDALENLQHTYPRDFELPRLLAKTITQVKRIDDDRAQADLQKLAHLLIYNYPDSPEAATVLPAAEPDHAVPPAESGAP